MGKIESYLDQELTREHALAIAKLINNVWPSANKTVEEGVSELLTAGTCDNTSTADPAQPESRRYVIWHQENAVAHARTFSRTIFMQHEAIPAMALADVCVHSDHRGEGLGAMVVLKAFERVDQGIFPISLFQTGVPGFYQKLGARIIENRFVNSKNKNAPEQAPWWDRHVMIYPAAYPLRRGTIDLNGAGY